MKKYDISEMFFSLEGEGPETNHPTQYLRTGSCNLKCPFFNNPDKLVDEDGYAKLDFDPTQIISIYEMPTINIGCDSTYACRKSFSHLWESLTASEIADKLVQQLPNNQWVYPSTKLPIIFSITGGEPTMQQDLIMELLYQPQMNECQHILIETNCSVPLKEEFIRSIKQWLDENEERKWTWSNSPKLSASGEPWKRAIRPKVALSQLQTKTAVFAKTEYPDQVNQYFKFVVDNTIDVYDEVQKAMQEYYAAGVPVGTPIWLMPCACTAEQQKLISREVAKYCMQNGYLYSHRIQNDLWDNSVGT